MICPGDLVMFRSGIMILSPRMGEWDPPRTFSTMTKGPYLVIAVIDDETKHPWKFIVSNTGAMGWSGVYDNLLEVI
jgi:hypothetical protein